MNKGPAGSGPFDQGFERAYELHSREVWALVYARLLNADLALDLMQETFLRLWKHGLTGEALANVRAWLLRVARNLAEDCAKSSFRRNGTSSSAAMDNIPGERWSPHDLLEREENQARVRAELALLPVPDREVLSMRYALEYPVEEIAQVLGISLSAVHMRLSRARQRLRERLE